MTDDGLDASRAARDAAMVQAFGNAHVQWKTVAAGCLDWLIRSKDRWTTDDFWEAMAQHYPDVTTHEPRALGPMLASLVRAGRIEAVGTQLSRREVHHAFPLKVYVRPDRDARIRELDELLRQAELLHASIVARAEFLYDQGVRIQQPVRSPGSADAHPGANSARSSRHFQL